MHVCHMHKDAAMDKMPSSRFRVSYTDIREPVQVTANGRVIGVWTPEGAAMPQVKAEVKEPVVDEPLFTRTFTPAPKPTSRR